MSRDTLLMRRSVLIETLRPLDPVAVGELESVDYELFGLSKPPGEVLAVAPGEWSTVTIISAMIQYLKRVKRPVSEEEMIKAMVIAEAGGPEPKSTPDGVKPRTKEWKVRGSISWHLGKEKIIKKNHAGYLLLIDESAPIPVPRNR